MALSRRRKLILFLVVLPLVLVAAAIAALFTPAVQTFAARKALAGQGGEVDRVAVGLGGATLSGLRVSQPGLKLTVPDFRVDAPLTDLAGGKVEVRAMVARDVVVEVDPAAMQAAQGPAEPAPGEKPAAKGPFKGVLNEVDLPELRVDGIDIAGRVRVAGPQPVDATFALTGGGIRAGEAGRLELKIEAKAGLGSVVTTFTLRPTLGADGRIDALGAVAEALATSKLLAEPARLRATADIVRAGDGETYALRLLAGETPLVELDTRWAPGATELPGRWKIAIRDKDVAPFALGLALPEFTLAGGGDLTIAGAEKARLGGELNLAADGLEIVGLPKLGPVSLASKFAVEASATEARIDSLALDVKGASPVLTVETRQPFAMALATKTISPSRAGAELAEVRLLGVPSEWVKIFVPELGLGGPVTGAWTVRAEGDGFVAVSSQPLVATGVSYASAGQPLAAFDAVRIEDLRVKQDSAGLEATVGALRVLVAGAELVSAKVEATQKAGGPLRAKGELRALLAKLADQPALRGQTRLSAGQATVNFEASVAETLTAAAKLRLGGLRAAGAGDLPEVAIDADVTRDAKGVLVAKAPVTVRNAKANRSSDLLLEATVTPGRTETHIGGKLSSAVLFVEDLQAFAALAAETVPAAKPTETPGAKPGPQTPSAPTGPLWAGTTGEVELALARIVYAPGIEVTNTKGRLALTKEAASLETLQMLLGTGGAVDMSGALKWVPASKGYTLGADVTGKGVAVGPILKALNPGEAPKLDGTYDLTAKVAGQGSDPGAAAAGAAADVKLTGKKGTLRVLNFETSRFAKLASPMAQTVTGLLGVALGGDSKAGEYAGYASAAIGITRQLSNLAYDEIAIEATRAADGSVEIGKVNLMGSQLQLTGGGGLRMVPGRSLWELPLKLQLQLGAKGDMARYLGKLNLLAPPAEGAAADAFALMKEPLVLDGSLKQVGTDQITRLLTRAAGL